MRSSALALGALLALATSGCDRGGADDVSVTVTSQAFPTADVPSYVIAGARARVSLFAQFGGPEQAVYESNDGAVRVRTLFDPATKLPVAMIDEVTGHYLLVVQRVDGGVEVVHFSSADTYLEGIALVADGDTYLLGTLAGRPAFAGQIQAQMSANSVGTGSFAAIGTPTALLDNLEDVSDDIIPLLTLLGGSTTARPPLAQSAALTLGALVITGAHASSLGDAYVAAGVATALAGLFTDNLDLFVETNFASDDPLVTHLVTVALTNLRLRRQDHAEFFQQIIDRARALAAGPVDPPDPLDVTHEVVDLLDAPPLLPVEDQPAPYDGPPKKETPITGQAVWTDNTVNPISGSVDANGIVRLASTDTGGGTPLVQISGSISGEDFSGTYSRGDMPGTAIGKVTGVSACSISTTSGGEGTFTNVHFVGIGSGVVDFIFDAQSIPDAFSVSVGGTTAFMTAGLVSGVGNAQIPIAGEQFVFVSVSAPNSGTAWSYQLGCLP